MDKYQRKPFQRGAHDSIEWIRIRSREPAGLVFAPPLIGGGAAQQIRMLRHLRVRSLDVFSFSYAGHGGSGGCFSISDSLENGVAMLRLAMSICRSEGLPLFGLATCYGAVPLLHAARQCGEPMRKLVLINAVPGWRLRVLWRSFMGYLHLKQHQRLAPLEVLQALRAYLNELFPGIIRWKEGFGALAFQRLNWVRMIWEAFVLQPLENHCLARTNVLCFYSAGDPLLSQMGWRNTTAYENAIRQVCPRTVFKALDSDHYLSDLSLRCWAADCVKQFFLETDGVFHPNGQQLPVANVQSI